MNPQIIIVGRYPINLRLLDRILGGSEKSYYYYDAELFMTIPRRTVNTAKRYW